MDQGDIKLMVFFFFLFIGMIATAFLISIIRDIHIIRIERKNKKEEEQWPDLQLSDEEWKELYEIFS